MTAFCTFELHHHHFAFPAHYIKEVTKELSVIEVALVASQVAGIANLRGSLVTVVDLCKILLIDECIDCSNCRHLIIEQADGLYSFPINEIGDIIDVPQSSLSIEPGALPAELEKYAAGIYKQGSTLTILLDPSEILTLEESLDDALV